MAQTSRNSRKRARERTSLYRDHGDSNDDQSYDVAAMTTRTLEASSSSREARAEHHDDPPAVANSCNTAITSRSLRKGMVILKGFLSFREQEELTAHAHQLGRLPEGGFYLSHNEKTKRMRMMNLGLRTDGGRHNLRIPQAWTETAVRACRAAAELDASIPVLRPDICVVNHYTVESRLGWHQDLFSSRDPGLPVVSLSLGEPATFQYRISWRKTSGVKSVTLESGDAFVFGGRSRGIIHAVPGIGKNAAAAASNSVATKARSFRSSPSKDGRSELTTGAMEETPCALPCRVPGGGRFNLNFREL